MVTKSHGLWFRLLRSAWWKEIITIRDSVGSTVGTWFPDNLCLKVGNGGPTLFWIDRWVGDVPLQVRFSRLFELSKNELLTVAQMFQLGWEEGGCVEVEKGIMGLGGGVVSGV